MASDVPAFLEVGTPVSAKFKGAFCEAAIKSIKKNIKCKVAFKDAGLNSMIVSDDVIDGLLTLNSLVLVTVGDEKKEAIIQRMNDHSSYTVVFDDGDEKTLRRTNVCVMGEKHFNENENLDNLPLTDPENFSAMVVLSADKRRNKRRRPQLNCTLEEEEIDSDESKLKRWQEKRWNAEGNSRNEANNEHLGKVVCIELGERKKSWFPGLGLKHCNNSEQQVYIQSFKDGKKMIVKGEDVKEFSKEKDPIYSFLKGDLKVDPILRSAIGKALAYHDLGELPKGWNILDTIDEKEESTDDESPHSPPQIVLSAEASAFHDTLTAVVEKISGHSLKPPTINNQPVNLHKLYQLVTQIGGFIEVSNQQWRTIYTKLGLRNIHTTASFNMKSLYKRYILPYEEQTMGGSPSSSRSSPRTVRKVRKKDDDKSSVASESESEADRRRSTRSTRGLAADNSEKKWMDGEEGEQMDVKLVDIDVDVINSPQSSSSEEINTNSNINSKYKAGNRISVHYGNGKNQRLYNAKILEVDEENDQVLYYVHYSNWNHRYDEWVKEERIAGLSAPSKKRNPVPPTSITKIAKDPPLRYKQRSNQETPPPPPPTVNKPTVPKPVIVENKLPVLKSSPAATPTYETFTPVTPDISFQLEQLTPAIEKSTPLKPTSLGTIPSAHDALKTTPLPPHHKIMHRPKPVTDALFIPDIKPSPIKPRMTRNSMQDTILLTVLEESIGKSLQSEGKAEPLRRSVRQQQQSPEHVLADDEDSLPPPSSLHTTTPLIGGKEAVKRWIEDSMNLEHPPMEVAEHSEEGKRRHKNSLKVIAQNSTEGSKESTNNNNIGEDQQNTLDAFCSIVENAPKLETPTETTVPEGTMFKEEATSPDDLSPVSKEAPSPTKKRHHQHKKRRSHHSYSEDHKPKSRREKRPSPSLEYNIDFMSDLASTLDKKDAVERIALMQQRLFEMSQLYSKLRSEVASIDRKKKRKLRKQINKSSNNT